MRSASAGSTRVARRAGDHAATSATVTKQNTGKARLDALKGSISNKNVRTNLAKYRSRTWVDASSTSGLVNGIMARG